MVGRIKQAGGLVGLNTGSVIDCYNKIKLHHTPHMVSGGFCGENRGKILRCVTQESVSGKGQKAGFCARQTGVCTDSFWLRHEGQKENQWTDWAQSLSVGELEENEYSPLNGREAWFLDRKHGGPELKLYDRGIPVHLCGGNYRRHHPLRGVVPGCNHLQHSEDRHGRNCPNSPSGDGVHTGAASGRRHGEAPERLHL